MLLDFQSRRQRHHPLEQEPVRRCLTFNLLLFSFSCNCCVVCFIINERKNSAPFITILREAAATITITDVTERSLNSLFFLLFLLFLNGVHTLLFSSHLFANKM